MPSAGPTVKSLDERMDDLERSLHSEVADLRVALADQGHQLDLKINGKFADLEKLLDTFKAEVRVSLNFAKWIGAFAATVIVALIAFGFQFSSANGRLEQRVTNLEEKVDEVKQRMTIVEQKVDEVKQRVTNLEQKVDEVKQRMTIVEQKVDELKQILLKRLPKEDKE